MENTEEKDYGSFNEDTVDYFKQFYHKPGKDFWVDAGIFIYTDTDWDDDDDRRELLDELERLVFDS